jgi:hypothetical protein
MSLNREEKKEERGKILWALVWIVVKGLYEDYGG